MAFDTSQAWAAQVGRMGLQIRGRERAPECCVRVLFGLHSGITSAHRSFLPHFRAGTGVWGRGARRHCPGPSAASLQAALPTDALPTSACVLARTQLMSPDP